MITVGRSYHSWHHDHKQLKYYNCLAYIKRNLESFYKSRELDDHNIRNKNLDVPFCQLSKTADSFPTITVKMFNSMRRPGTFPTRLFLKRVSIDLKGRLLYSAGEFF